MIHFEIITKENYSDVINLHVADSQIGFVCDNATSLVEATYEEGLYARAIYDDDNLIGFLLFDYDLEIPGWSLSRFMIDAKYQNQGLGKSAINLFIKYFKNTFSVSELFASVELNNTKTIKVCHELGFIDIKPINYTYGGIEYHEQLMKLLI